MAPSGVETVQRVNTTRWIAEVRANNFDSSGVAGTSRLYLEDFAGDPD